MTDNRSQEIENVYKVKLEETTRTSATRRRVTFEVTPDLIENRNVNYKTVEPVHAPGTIYVYGSTSSRNFNISNARLISRTPIEAEQNLKRLQLLRSWTLPRFGSSTLSEEQRFDRLVAISGQSTNPDNTIAINDIWDQEQVLSLDRGTEVRGAPPRVLFLSAYSANGIRRGRPNLRRIPVVIQQLSIAYPSDVDYIPANVSRTPMPTLMTIDMTLLEAHSPQEFLLFSLDQYRKGILPGF